MILQKLNHGQQGITIDVLRLDAIHPIVSGNKWFKLKNHINEALRQNKKGILSFGGAYSNHLVATAYACYTLGLPSIGIIRGESPAQFGDSLRDMQEYGMVLEFYNREEYENKKICAYEFEGDYYVIPEGGKTPLGIAGSEEILSLVPSGNYSHIACAVGTGTMMTGLINASASSQQVIGISSLKISDKLNNDLLSFIRLHARRANFSLWYDYHFGGYGKKNQELIGFMNAIYEQYRLPTDFVYTGKLLYAVFDRLGKNHFPTGSNILVIHSGGLQGNRSIRKGVLEF